MKNKQAYILLSLCGLLNLGEVHASSTFYLSSQEHAYHNFLELSTAKQLLIYQNYKVYKANPKEYAQLKEDYEFYQNYREHLQNLAENRYQEPKNTPQTAPAASVSHYSEEALTCDTPSQLTEASSTQNSNADKIDTLMQQSPYSNYWEVGKQLYPEKTEEKENSSEKSPKTEVEEESDFWSSLEEFWDELTDDEDDENSRERQNSWNDSWSLDGAKDTPVTIPPSPEERVIIAQRDPKVDFSDKYPLLPAPPPKEERPSESPPMPEYKPPSAPAVPPEIIAKGMQEQSPPPPLPDFSEQQLLLPAPPKKEEPTKPPPPTPEFTSPVAPLPPEIAKAIKEYYENQQASPALPNSNENSSLPSPSSPTVDPAAASSSPKAPEASSPQNEKQEGGFFYNLMPVFVQKWIDSFYEDENSAVADVRADEEAGEAFAQEDAAISEEDEEVSEVASGAMEASDLELLGEELVGHHQTHYPEEVIAQLAHKLHMSESEVRQKIKKGIEHAKSKKRLHQ